MTTQIPQMWKRDGKQDRYPISKGEKGPTSCPEQNCRTHSPPCGKRSTATARSLVLGLWGSRIDNQ